MLDWAVLTDANVLDNGPGTIDGIVFSAGSYEEAGQVRKLR